MPAITPFLMFEGKAEQALKFYVSLFPNSEIKSVRRYEEGEAKGSVMHAIFSLDGRDFMCIDSPIKHGFTFTPATSLHVACKSEHEIDTLFAALSADGSVLMPLGEYPFAKKYAWLNDRFGVSWQLAFNE
jgi:predicted 3-demethylubiquinone-9 3-methyltransferase (glyoxalase superfamily)